MTLKGIQLALPMCGAQSCTQWLTAHPQPGLMNALVIKTTKQGFWSCQVSPFILDHHLRYPSSPTILITLPLSKSVPLTFPIFLNLEYPRSLIPGVSTYFVPFSLYNHGCGPLTVFCQLIFHISSWRTQPLSLLYKHCCGPDMPIPRAFPNPLLSSSLLMPIRPSLIYSSHLLPLWANLTFLHSSIWFYP